METSLEQVTKEATGFMRMRRALLSWGVKNAASLSETEMFKKYKALKYIWNWRAELEMMDVNEQSIIPYIIDCIRGAADGPIGIKDFIDICNKARAMPETCPSIDQAGNRVDDTYEVKIYKELVKLGWIRGSE